MSTTTLGAKKSAARKGLRGLGGAAHGLDDGVWCQKRIRETEDDDEQPRRRGAPAEDGEKAQNKIEQIGFYASSADGTRWTEPGESKATLAQLCLCSGGRPRPHRIQPFPRHRRRP
jgi:hypothetical protein